MAETRELTQERSGGLDALRMLAMGMVVCYHLLLHGGVLNGAQPLSGHYWMGHGLMVMVNVGVDVYALLTGYVMAGRRAKLGSLLSRWTQVWFWSVVLTAVMLLAVPSLAGEPGLWAVLFPITTSQYWYVTAYFGVYLLSPLLNAAMDSMSRGQLRQVLLCLLVAMSILPTLLRMPSAYNLGGGYSMAWLILLYLAGGWLARYGLPWKLRAGQWLGLYLLCSAVTFLSKVWVEYITLWWLGECKLGNLLTGYTSPTVVLGAVCLVMAGATFRPSQRASRVFTLLAGPSLGVYLIHEQNLVRTALVKQRWAWLLELSPLGMAAATVACAAGIYLLCALLEGGRMALFQALGIPQRCRRLGERLERWLEQREE